LQDSANFRWKWRAGYPQAPPARRGALMAPNLPVDLWITLVPERTPKNPAVENIGGKKGKPRILDKFIHSRHKGIHFVKILVS
jgi:hypothetical protein